MDSSRRVFINRSLLAAGGAMAAQLACNSSPNGEATAVHTTEHTGFAPAYLQLGRDPSKAADARIFYVARCDDGSLYSNTMNYDPTDRVRDDGRMRRSQRWEDLRLEDGTILEETQVTDLRFNDTSVTGTVRIEGAKNPPNGRPIPCTTGPMRVSLQRCTTPMPPSPSWSTGR